MADTLPVRKFVKVWIKKRKNNPKNDGTCTTSYTLEWVEFGQRRFISLGPHATAGYARQAAAQKERELNSMEQSDNLDPISWDDLTKKYLDTFFPGHDLLPAGRKIASTSWSKGLTTMLRERSSINSFTRLIKPRWCHEITGEEREQFITERLKEVGSAASVNVELAVLRHVFNVAEEWKHRPENSNPFAGKGKATVGSRRKRSKERERGEAKAEYYTIPQIVSLLSQADKEVAEHHDDWNRRRLRALIYFEAYTGARVRELLHLEWSEINLGMGIAFLHFKIENDLKTEGSAAPFGLPDALVIVLHDWQQHATCNWVFPNSEGKPWVNAGPGYKPLDQLKALAKRAGIDHATWKMFRHSFDTHGKGKFGMTKEQMRAQLRHTTDETQKHYDHDDLGNLRAAVKNIDFRR